MIDAQKVIAIVRETRALSLPKWGQVSVLAVKDDTGSGEVTEIDRAIELLLTQKLKEIYPDIPFVGEEFGGDMGAKMFWLCDPIDGTAHYIRGLPFCTTMLCLVVEGQVMFSCIYDFIQDCMYYAEKGSGAWKHDYTKNEAPVRLRVSGRPSLRAYIGYESQLHAPGMVEYREKVRAHCVLINTICVGWEMIQVAQGKIEGRIQYNPYGFEHDFAPGSLLVSEAGGVVVNIGATTYDFKNTDFMAVTPNVFKALTEGSDAIFPITQHT